MNEEKTERRKSCQFSGVRYLFSLLGFLGFCTLYAIRVNLNVAIVAMVNRTAVYGEADDNSNSSNECHEELPAILINETIPDLPSKDGEFVWSPNLQAVVLGAFYYGYCISQIPGGRLAEIFGPKWVFGFGTLIPSLLTLLTPIAAQWHVGFLVTVRALEGLAQGVTMPAMHSMMGRWLPESEKSLLSTAVYVGINIGTVVTMPLAAFLCDQGPFGGWPSAFYIVGLFGCLWFVFWSIFVTDSPQEHPYITKSELKYIVSDQKIEHNILLPPIPWTKVLTSVPFLALIVTQIGQDWCFYTIVNDLPTFFATILHFKVQKNGFLSSFPHLLQTIVGILVGFISDACVRRKLVTVGFARKFCNTVACLGTAAGLIGVCLAGCDVTLHIIFFTCSLAIGGFCYSGYMLSHLDLSPEYAGTLMGIANTISNLTGFLAPLVVGSLTEHYQTLHQWHIVFYITVGVLLATGLVFLIFSSAEKQPWSAPTTTYTLLHSSSEHKTLHIQTSYGTV
ncbi:putative inorganic phosphate cotransporter [Uloborus diversus]|uniref:putative inorganic phosphate cotransporter n=1 Tax=Uloborus diversus TaxID=327109 RepID=UPI0024098585|nr:putative inorganic phosphate cotransporter [Uloborus diversus]XP_054716533.1 putative inorganic phosphate cotransporter [Uloborus diversus]